MAENVDIPEQSIGYQGNDEVPGQVTTRLCQPCSNSNKQSAATVFCLNCREFQCKECSNVHSIYSFMKTHKLADASAASALTVAYDMNGLDRCEKHDKFVKFFCMDDKKLCCSTCAIIEHRKCSRVDEIKNIDVEQSETNTLKANINNLRERNEDVVRHLIDSEKSLQEQVKELLNRLGSVRKIVYKLLNDLEEDILKQITALSESKAKEYSDYRAQCEETLTVLKHELEMLDIVTRQGPREQVFIVQQRVTESLETTKERAISELENTELSLELSNTFESLIDSREKLGSIQANTSKIKVDDICDGRPVVLEKIVSIDVGQSEDDTKGPLFSGMDFLPDGRLVVVDNYNRKCLVFSDKLEILGSCKLSDKPLRLTVVTGDEVAVTIGTRIDILKVSSSSEICKTRTVKTVSKCDSICVKDDEHFVVGTYNEAKPVRIVSYSGEENDFNIDFPSKQLGLSTSACTYIKNRDKVVLTDCHAHTVYIYDVMTNTSVIVKDELIKKPRSLTIGPFDSIFVCSNSMHSIVQISHTGRILSYLKLDMTCLYSICVTKDITKLAVTNNAVGKRKLQLFNIKSMHI